MFRGRLCAAAMLVTAIPAVAFASATALTDSQVRQEIIRESIARRPGNCPCPYNRASNGSRCGGRSSYGRGGGYAPICFDSDVSDEMVAEYRRRRSR